MSRTVTFRLRMPARWRRLCAAVMVPAVLALSLLGGCNGGGSSVATTGTLRVGLTDKQDPQFQQVVIAIREVRLVPAGLENAADNDPRLPVVVSYSAPHSVDIIPLHLQQELLGTVVVSAGTYNQIRLILEPNPPGQALPQNYVTLKTAPTVRIPLDTPSAQQSGLKVLGQFKAQAGQINAVLIDFDPTTAIVPRGNGGFNLKPTGIRIVQSAEALAAFGSLSGRVVATFSDWSSATVTVVPQGSANAIAAGTVFSNHSGSRWVGPFSVFAPSGTYRVHVQASRFAPYSTPQLTLVSGTDTPLGDLLLVPAP